MARATSLPRASLPRCSPSHRCRSAISGPAKACLVVWRASAVWPLMLRSMSNKASMRCTASRQIGDSIAGALPCAARRALPSTSGQHEELPPGVCPACGFEDRAWLASGLVELAVAAIGVGLEQPGIPVQMALRMLAAAVARVVENRPRRRRSPERPVVAHVGPEPGDVGLNTRQDRHGGVVAVDRRGRLTP